MSFPEQEHKLTTEGFDPDTRARFRLRVDEDTEPSRCSGERRGTRSLCRAADTWRAVA